MHDHRTTEGTPKVLRLSIVSADMVICKVQNKRIIIVM